MASTCLRYSLQMASMAPGVAAADVGMKRATNSPWAVRSAMALSESFHLPAWESPEKRYRSRWSWRMTPGVMGMLSWLSWTMSKTYRYPAISRSSRFFGSTFSSISSRRRLSEVEMFSILFEALVLWILATSTKAAKRLGWAAESRDVLPLSSRMFPRADTTSGVMRLASALLKSN